MTLREELIQVAAVAVAIVQDLDSETTGWLPATYRRGFAGDWLSSVQDQVFDDIAFERAKQERKWGPQHHSPEEWLAILAEEVGEAAREVYKDSVGSDLFDHPEWWMAIALHDAELAARAFLEERFPSAPS